MLANVSMLANDSRDDLASHRSRQTRDTSTMPCPLGYAAQPEVDESEQAIDGDATLTEEQKAAAKEAHKVC
jgi:hypothetical protein